MKCRVCGKRFKALANNKYLAVEKIGAIESIAKRPKTYECFDCLKCGCQNIVNVREERKESDQRES